MITRILPLLLTAALAISSVACHDTPTRPADEFPCGRFEGHQLYWSPSTGCYWYDADGNQVHVGIGKCGC